MLIGAPPQPPPGREHSGRQMDCVFVGGMRDVYNAILLRFAAGAVWDVQRELALVRFQAAPAAFIGRKMRW